MVSDSSNMIQRLAREVSYYSTRSSAVSSESQESDDRKKQYVCSKLGFTPKYYDTEVIKKSSYPPAKKPSNKIIVI